MTKNKKSPSFKVVKPSIFVFLICIAGLIVIHCGVSRIDASRDAISAMSFLATIFGLLAGGCISSFYSFEYKDVEPEEKRSVVGMAYLMIGGIFTFVFLSFYCLQRAGIFSYLDPWALRLLFLGTYAVLNSIVLLERWDATQLPT
jgi:hypothetical protein